MRYFGFQMIVALKFAFILEDIIINSFMHFLNLTSMSLIIMTVIQCVCLILALITLFISFFNTFICEAGLMTLLCRKFALTIIVLIIYLVLSIVLYAWELSVRWPRFRSNVWSTGFSALFGIHRCFAVIYYYFYKRAALRLGDPHFHEDAEWIRLEFERRR